MGKTKDIMVFGSVTGSISQMDVGIELIGCVVFFDGDCSKSLPMWIWKKPDVKLSDVCFVRIGVCPRHQAGCLNLSFSVPGNRDLEIETWKQGRGNRDLGRKPWEEILGGRDLETTTSKQT